MIWEQGPFESGLKNNSNSKYFYNRAMLLQCLLAVCSSKLYQKKNTGTAENHDPFIIYLLSSKNEKVFELFFSLLNTIMKFTPMTTVLFIPSDLSYLSVLDSF